MTMLSSTHEHDAVRNVTELEVALGDVEFQLEALGQALKDHDPAATELAATDLHRALTHAVRRFGTAAGRGGVPPALRRRLAMASGLVAAQRDAVARATSLLDRAIDVLLPAPPILAAPMYGAHGGSQRAHTSGLAQA
jgi:hypothetical protein